MLELLNGHMLQGRFDGHIVAHFAEVFCGDVPQFVVPECEEGRLGGLQP